jgi:hypothetical protein
MAVDFCKDAGKTWISLGEHQAREERKHKEHSNDHDETKQQ